MNSGVRFFHGGCRGLEAGDLLFPATETGVPSVSGAAGHAYKPDHIYLTVSYAEARSYAAVFIPPETLVRLQRGDSIDIAELGGDVYEVEPIGELAPDLDHPRPGKLWQSNRARIVDVLERGVAPEV